MRAAVLFLAAASVQGVCLVSPRAGEGLGRVLTKCEAEDVKDGVLTLESLLFLSIAPDAFDSLSNVRELKIIANHPGVNNHDTTTLDAGVFRGLSDLERLDVNDSNVRVIENGLFSEFTKLEYMSFRGNEITSLEEGVFGENLSTLKTLDLASNSIASLEPDIFKDLTMLEELGLQNNEISAIEAGTFEGLSNLVTLRLAGNFITAVGPSGFEELTNLQELKLNNNRISLIQEGALTGLSSLKILDLQGNPSEDFTIEENAIAGAPLENFCHGKNFDCGLFSKSSGVVRKCYNYHDESYGTNDECCQISGAGVDFKDGNGFSIRSKSGDPLPDCCEKEFSRLDDNSITQYGHTCGYDVDDDYCTFMTCTDVMDNRGSNKCTCCEAHFEGDDHWMSGDHHDNPDGTPRCHDSDWTDEIIGLRDECCGTVSGGTVISLATSALLSTAAIMCGLW